MREKVVFLFLRHLVDPLVIYFKYRSVHVNPKLPSYLSLQLFSLVTVKLVLSSFDLTASHSRYL